MLVYLLFIIIIVLPWCCDAAMVTMAMIYHDRVEEEDKAGGQRGRWVEANSGGSFRSEDFVCRGKNSEKARYFFDFRMHIVFLDILKCFSFWMVFLRLFEFKCAKRYCF